MWLSALGRLPLIILNCKKFANEYKGLSMNEIITRNGQLDLCTLGGHKLWVVFRHYTLHYTLQCIVRYVASEM